MANTTLKQLATDMNAKADTLDMRASEIAVEVALEVVTHLAFNTPVDTTEAVSNWQVSLGSPVSVGSRLSPHRLGSERSREITINNAIDVLKAKQPGEAIFISNVRPNYNYIIKLNDGSSDQHPGGFIETAVLVGRNHVRKASL